MRSNEAAAARLGVVWPLANRYWGGPPITTTSRLPTPMLPFNTTSSWKLTVTPPVGVEVGVEELVALVVGTTVGLVLPDELLSVVVVVLLVPVELLVSLELELELLLLELVVVVSVELDEADELDELDELELDELVIGGARGSRRYRLKKPGPPQTSAGAPGQGMLQLPGSRAGEGGKTRPMPSAQIQRGPVTAMIALFAQVAAQVSTELAGSLVLTWLMSEPWVLQTPPMKLPAVGTMTWGAAMARPANKGAI